MKNKNDYTPKWELTFEQTFDSQIELLPRLTILYGKSPYFKGIAFEFLWFHISYLKEVSTNNQ